MTTPSESRPGAALVPALRLQGLYRRFGGVTAISDISLEVVAGARHGIIGPNGAGKTTLFNVISGELSASDGRIELFGRNVTRMSSVRRVRLGLGRTYQITRTFSTMTVRENLTLGVNGQGRHKFSMLKPWRTYSTMSAEVARLAEEFGLSHRLDSPASDLSHGEVRQLEVALAIALKPKLLLLDEPGAGLSPGERVGMRALLKGLSPDLTLIMIEHDMELVRDVVESMHVLDFGEVVADGPTREIQSDERVRRIYLGSRA
ncbi:MAG TPA: ABC transporter ATP-binding protein [Candidatus Acidoferrales bacterium]|nr:ABC transporter ATP-binding protein [Candidatus Acidoferrales bacterium]